MADKKKDKPIDPSLFEGLEAEVDWNFDDSEIKMAHKAIGEKNPKLAEILKKHANQGAIKKD